MSKEIESQTLHNLREAEACHSINVPTFFHPLHYQTTQESKKKTFCRTI
jgi:hypothetical protein